MDGTRDREGQAKLMTRLDRVDGLVDARTEGEKDARVVDWLHCAVDDGYFACEFNFLGSNAGYDTRTTTARTTKRGVITSTLGSNRQIFGVGGRMVHARGTEGGRGRRTKEPCVRGRAAPGAVIRVRANKQSR